MYDDTRGIYCRRRQFKMRPQNVIGKGIRIGCKQLNVLGSQTVVLAQWVNARFQQLNVRRVVTRRGARGWLSTRGKLAGTGDEILIGLKRDQSSQALRKLNGGWLRRRVRIQRVVLNHQMTGKFLTRERQRWPAQVGNVAGEDRAILGNRWKRSVGPAMMATVKDLSGKLL